MEQNSLQHIAVIPDGNRRWAKARAMKPWLGHDSGRTKFREITEAVFDQGIPYFTFWAASQANLTDRPKEEVDFLLQLMKLEIDREITEKNYEKNEVNFQVLGRWREIITDHPLVESLTALENTTKQFNKHYLTVLLGYDGRVEMLQAIQALQKNGEEVNEENLRKVLWTGNLPPADLVIRTGGEPHWSAGFMMWNTANSQLYFTDTLWPDFGKDELQKAIEEYKGKERRFGK
jgi:undecaprenyl diphosphate synthase